MKLEEQLLPHPDLKPLHDQAIWLYVYRSFAKDEADRAAERVMIRFGVTSWPQLLLADPATLAILEHTGRSVDSFRRAFAAVHVTKPGPAEAQALEARLAAREAQAAGLERSQDLAGARRLRASKDVVVRTRALEILARKDPAAVAKRALELLRVPNDPFRYLVCDVLARAADPAAADALEALARTPRNSLNPNVLRIHAVRALAACGDADSVEAVAPFASSGVYFNGLTGVAVEALAALAERLPATRPRVAAILRSGYPQPPAADDKRALRACVGLARRIHAALRDPRPFPDVYDAEARRRLMKAPG